MDFWGDGCPSFAPAQGLNADDLFKQLSKGEAEIKQENLMLGSTFGWTCHYKLTVFWGTKRSSRSETQWNACHISNCNPATQERIPSKNTWFTTAGSELVSHFHPWKSAKPIVPSTLSTLPKASKPEAPQLDLALDRFSAGLTKLAVLELAQERKSWDWWDWWEGCGAQHGNFGWRPFLTKKKWYVNGRDFNML